ncbi:MAG: hypothetical protein ACRAUM_06505 [Exiguobacterium indicum]
MERCSLCGTPLRQHDTTCSHCHQPVITKERPAEPSAPSSSRTWFISTCLLLFLVGGGGFLWYSLKDPVSPEAGQTPSVEALALSEWSDEQTAYNQTYSKDRPPTSYDVLRFVPNTHERSQSLRRIPRNTIPSRHFPPSSLRP